MSIDPSLKAALESLLEKQRRIGLWCRLAMGWAVLGLIGLAVLVMERITGWGSGLVLPILVLAALGVFFWLWKSHRHVADWRKLAAIIETHFPELDGRLLTAVQQTGRPDGELNYFQTRLLEEVMSHRSHNDWAAATPSGQLALARVLHWSAFALFLLVLPGLRTTGGTQLLARIVDSQLQITPGDTSLEKGSSLVVLARFSGPLPSSVDLVLGEAATTPKIALTKSLADPVFGGSVPEVQSNLTYRVEYAGHKSRDFKVSIFEYPRLESSDIDVTYPDYTGIAPKHIANTRRLSAVEGSHLDLSLRLNKSVKSAQLRPRDPGPVVPLQVDAQRPSAALKGFLLATNQTYDLLLTDADGRTNKVAAQFVFAALTNRTPEFQLTSPRGDQRPSPLEEINFEGTVYDDFGLVAYGLGYAIPGEETRFIELGKKVPGHEKRSFKHVLRLEELGLKSDQLISWFVWGDDLDSNGQVRRTTGDLFFGEIRPFEEVFREGMPMDGQSGGMSGRQNSPAARLTELQKQIINATWRLRREHPTPGAPQSRAADPLRGRYYAGGRPSLVFGQTAGPTPKTSSRARPGSAPLPRGASYVEDAKVVHDSQQQAIEQAHSAAEGIDDPRQEALWSAAIAEMEKARSRLQQATNSPAALAEAVAAEQAAYQALLKVQEHEFSVIRNQNRNQGGGGGRDQQMQRQLEQMDLTQSENRYETQRQAQRQQQQSGERREDLQVMSRLQELARRQQDLNERLKELQAALEEAKTESEREEIRRRLKRLQEEEQQMLADVDELKQRMDRPENQSRMSEERRQLEDTREDIQRAADAAASESPSQALASGTRAQRQLQDLRDNLRKKNSSQFADDLRQMRSDARELARRQEEISNQMQSRLQAERGRLSDSPEEGDLARQFQEQKERLTNLVQRATDISQQAEEAEPVLSRQLYDMVRKHTQDSARNVQEAQNDLLEHRLLTRDLYERLKRSTASDSEKLLDLSSELWRQDIRREDFRREASGVNQRARAGIDDLKRGVERAAESVLGDDTEALRLAQEQLKELTDQLLREMAQAGAGTNQTGAGGPESSQTGQGRAGAQGSNTNLQASAGEPGNRGQEQPGKPGQENPESGKETASAGQPQDGQQGGQQSAGQQQGGQQPGQQPGGQQGNSQQPGEQASQAQGQGQGQGQGGNSSSAGRQPGGQQPDLAQNQNGGQRGSRRGGPQNNNGGPNGGNYGGGGPGGWDWNRFWNDPGQAWSGPLIGENFGPWSDTLRDVEEMIDDPAMRNRVALARERARQMRQEYKRDRKKPDWAVVRLQVVDPLAEVRNQIADELARRQSNEALVPIDRDPVPSKYTDLVRRYYEELGKDRGR